MPIYEYKCGKCGEKFELKLGILHRRKSVKCPKCGAEEPERVFHPFSTDCSSDSSCSTKNYG
jgi:putative FmdB family regulatory protein